MDAKNLLEGRFEAERGRLTGIAYRMLGSAAEAEDAVQEAWMKASRAGGTQVGNIAGWLTTIVARICLDMLRARRARREAPEDAAPPEAANDDAPRSDPEAEAMLADSVGLAMLVVLERLTPAEWVAFVLHDLFDLNFDEVARVVERSPEAARQLASRARRRVRGADPDGEGEGAPDAALAADRARRRALVEAFLRASREGDIEGLMAVLDPEVTYRTDAAARALGGRDLAGAAAVAQAMKGRAQRARVALVDGEVGVVVAPKGRLLLVLHVEIAGGRIASIEALADPGRLSRIDLALIDG
ncbi:MAG TPA: sigma-70 family RNA polymerase sigma factor [Acetobacteraceae bacterium]|nr:sigma-70 family RNA polymerase sigma factor [Acetobacteraceae bacterium]